MVERGDIVQIIDESHPWFPALIVVDEPSSYGCQGYTLIVDNTPDLNKRALVRLNAEQYEKVGKAALVAVKKKEPHKW